MRIIGHGIDLVACKRIERMVDRYGDHFIHRVFTAAEWDYCAVSVRRVKIESLAGRFAAKEAVLKALGTGWRGGVSWTDVETINASSGQPQVRLHAYTANYAKQLGVTDMLISLSHADGFAIASALAVQES